MDIFFDIHRDLPREGPGSAASTRRAFELARPHLPATPRILDIGCGPGAQTLELARLCDGEITAVDTHLPFLKQLEQQATSAGLGGRIHPLEMSMFDLRFEPGSFDLIWSEGAIYFMGFEEGLKAWHPLLAPGGCLAVSEVSWLRPDIPAELRAFWESEYPAIRSIEANLECIAATRPVSWREDWRLLGHFTLPASDWWDDYYAPIEARLAELRHKYAGDDDAQAELDLHQREIDIFLRYSAFYSYEFYVVQT